MKISELIQLLDELQSKHGDLPVVVGVNGYDSEDQECDGASYREPRSTGGINQYGDNRRNVPSHFVIESGIFWDSTNPLWTKPEDDGCSHPVEHPPNCPT